MNIRLAVSDDVDAVLALIRGTPELPQWNRPTIEDALREDEPANHPVLRRLFVAERSGCLLGFAQTSLLLGEGEIESLAVTSACRRQGVGRSLLHWVLEQARADGGEVFRLEVRSGNRAALRLYEEAGFRSVGVRRNYYSDPVEDAIQMELRWNDHPTPLGRNPHPVS